jgi:uncharacterized Tic20 family protein
VCINKNKIIVESFFIRKIIFYSIFTNRSPSKKNKSEIIEKNNKITKNVRFFFSLYIVLAFILFLLALLVDIRNSKRIKRIQVEKTIFCGFKHIVHS